MGGLPYTFPSQGDNRAPAITLTVNGPGFRHEYSSSSTQDFPAFESWFPRECWPTSIWAGQKAPSDVREVDPALEAYFEANNYDAMEGYHLRGYDNSDYHATACIWCGGLADPDEINEWGYCEDCTDDDTERMDMFVSESSPQAT